MTRLAVIIKKSTDGAISVGIGISGFLPDFPCGRVPDHHGPCVPAVAYVASFIMFVGRIGFLAE